MASVTLKRPADWRERQKAVDISLSCIVQAPAGSGKTELLVQRILALLAVADSPEEILSITFTRKAAGEMRQRLLGSLQDAALKPAPKEDYAKETWLRACTALERDREKGWNLLQNPSRLQLTTIDSFCAYLARRMPWLSRFGDLPAVTDDPDELYRKAVENLLSRLEMRMPGYEAIESLLVHMDNRLPLLRDLLVSMLGKRDQWLRHLAGQNLKKSREVLEGWLSLYVSTFLSRAYSTVGEQNYCELRELALYAAGNLVDTDNESNLSFLLSEEQDLNSVGQWLEMVELALTTTGSVRKSINKNNGFPADKTPQALEMKSRAQQLLEIIRENEAISNCLQDIRKLPAAKYENCQWRILEALIELLPLAAYELREVFRARNLVDFIEIAGAANAALGEESAPEDLLLQLDSKIRHILVDEFQDTSYAQYGLLNRLTSGWTPGDGRSLFVVGDPMQSIYRFREAEVGLYLHVCQRGLNNLPMEHVSLNTNFRSNMTVVDWTNYTFRQLFPEEANTLSGAVPFSPAVAYDQSEHSVSVSLQSFMGRQDFQEAKNVIEIVENERKKGSVAILVRSRGHLGEIVPALKRAGITYQAQDIDSLTERPVVQDILSLVKALYRPADRVSWLSVLRAPWCGLTLNDLVSICGHDSKSTIWELITNTPLQNEMFDPLTSDGRERLVRIIPVLKDALENVSHIPMRTLVESTWLRLGGPACYSVDDLQDVEQTFVLLESLDKGVSLDELEIQLGKLFAAPANIVDPDVQLMTIHKAKGLEFDTVILPGLGRGVRGADRALLRWLEHPEFELLLAPIPPLLSSAREATYDAIGNIQKNRADLETVRLLYVATTRAKRNLHLLGHVVQDSKGEYKPTSGSLMGVLWPACQDDFLGNMTEPLADENDEKTPQKIRRLPVDWSLPEMPPLLCPQNMKPQVASEHSYAEAGIHSRVVEEGKVVGTLVHEYLELIAKEGRDSWSKERLVAENRVIANRLGSNGVSRARIELCTEIVTDCLNTTLNSQRGRWLLDKHKDDACELPVNGVIDKQLIHATIDRTFVCENGIRWIIDYKTSSPGPGESEADFLSSERELYKNQLEIYQFLLGKLYPDEAIRSALYFPRIDAWVE